MAQRSCVKPWESAEDSAEAEVVEMEMAAPVRAGPGAGSSCLTPVQLNMVSNTMPSGWELLRSEPNGFSLLTVPRMDQLGPHAMQTHTSLRAI